jgi:hypothetical protein
MTVPAGLHRLLGRYTTPLVPALRELFCSAFSIRHAKALAARLSGRTRAQQQGEQQHEMERAAGAWRGAAPADHPRELWLRWGGGVLVELQRALFQQERWAADALFAIVR